MGLFKQNRKLPTPKFSPFKKGVPGSGISSSKMVSGDYIRGFSKGSDLIKEGKYEEAEKILITTAKRFKDDNFTAVLILADALFLQEKFQEAEELYRACVKLMPVIAHARYGMALVLKKNGKNEEANVHEEIVKKLGDLPIGTKIPDYLPSL